MEIKLYEKQYFDQLCVVMDMARMQELKSENLEPVFVALKEAPYLEYFLSCKIYVAIKKGRLVGLMEKVITELQRPIRLEVFTNNEQAKALYEKFGFQTIETIIENWSDEYPVKFSQDTMELR